MSALVGPSGSGKSTFVDLLPRLREPTGGNILLDGTKISEFSLESLRGAIAFVPQQPQIFNISASEHIRYGKDDATDAEIREAARLAGALPFIEALPEGFDTLLGDGGGRLSGGQRQRLDIARALVRRAPILILDEPTSALDAEAEWAFRETLQTLRSETDLTIVVIAHRLSTIADAERIVVLRGGKVEAVGSHERLLAAGGWYAEAYKMQIGALSAPQSAQIVA
jgi:ABC-type multidrug transport system fused ATPase/permease subunit